MKTVKEISKITGVSVRTLHHYDEIGLLKPTKLTDAGYRLYDDIALNRLQNILLFRELRFPLKNIKKILDSSCFDSREALKEQIKLLELEKAYLENLISHAREILKKGAKNMDFSVFDKTEVDKYKEEVKARWGNTEAYKEYEQRGSNNNADGLMIIFEKIGALKNLLPEDSKVQEEIKNLHNFITENYYTCTKEILFSLGEMYIADERFKKNIDERGGDGTADFVNRAIKLYCERKD